jgi:hypothetical protein
MHGLLDLPDRTLGENGTADRRSSPDEPRVAALGKIP